MDMKDDQRKESYGSDELLYGSFRLFKGEEGWTK